MGVSKLAMLKIPRDQYIQPSGPITTALAELPPISIPAPKLSPGDLIGTVPLLNGLATELLEGLAKKATPVTFLSDDTIIGEGDRGDALYIISHGQVKVFHPSDPANIIAELRDGDFFGEMALLGDQVRTASVKALIPTTLLRLTRRDVLSLAESEPELKNRLVTAQETRSMQS